MPDDTRKLAPLPDASIYDGIEKLNIEYDPQSWPSAQSDIFEKLCQKHAPKTIVEIGSHKGVSARKWAQFGGPDCKVYCVDTWLQAADAYLNPCNDWKMTYDHGHPMTFWSFLNNIKKSGAAPQVVPIVNSSAEGAIILKAHGIVAQIIYVDGTHTYRGAYEDISDYWPLLESGGALLVDDLTLYPAVFAACLRFQAENDLWKAFSVVDDGVFGLFIKP